jgi:hypothetical protein
LQKLKSLNLVLPAASSLLTLCVKLRWMIFSPLLNQSLLNISLLHNPTINLTLMRSQKLNLYHGQWNSRIKTTITWRKKRFLTLFSNQLTVHRILLTSRIPISLLSSRCIVICWW